MKTGLVLEGSATFGCNYKSKQIGRTIRYNMKYCSDPRYCSFRSLLKTGDLYDAEFCYHILPEQLDLFDNETYESNPTEFHMVTTDVNTGKPVYYKCDKFDHKGLGSVYVLCPKEKLPIGRIEHKPERLKAVYDIGREIAMEHLEEIKSFLKL